MTSAKAVHKHASHNVKHWIVPLEIEKGCTATLVAHFVGSFQLLIQAVATGVAVEEVLFSSNAAYSTFVTVELLL